MTLEETLGFCLSSQEIRARIKSDNPTLIVPSFDENRIQPSSFEPVLSDELFILDTEIGGIFRPQSNEQIYRTLLQLPGRRRKREDISNGFEINKGFTYLIPLEERIILSKGERNKSSPKSSFGRIFLQSRLLADYNLCFDEINFQYKTDCELNMWLLVQPHVFNMIIYPGLSFNQLRFLTGKNPQLTPAELELECEKNPLLYDKGDKQLIPSKPIITDGLQIHLDLSGKNTGGIVGLRARHNPTPIDLRKKEEYEAELFFEPIKSDKSIMIKRGEHYLFSSKEVLRIPSRLDVELKSHSHIGLTGPLHFAGFIDNGFEGDLVFEIRSDELSGMELVDGMPVSNLDVFRTKVPDKLYGKAIGSNYFEQIGPKPAKFFKPFDFNFAARNYKKLDRTVLVQEAKILASFRNNTSGFELLEQNKIPGLYRAVENGFFQSRYDCEFDELILQPISYVVFFGNNGTVFSYVRAADIKEFGEKRLFGKHSVGVGGHIDESDAPGYIKNCLEREVKEEVHIKGLYSEPKLVGTILDYSNPVDRVHFGLVFVVKVDGTVALKERSAVSATMAPIDKLMKDEEEFGRHETWSKCLIPHLAELYKYAQQTKLRN
jgi:predicted NUDIX family phosphoesterase/deoxycytidine triphosphate deaminase